MGLLSIYRKIEKKYSDEEILEAYRLKKEASLLAPLFERYMHLVFGVCLKYLKDNSRAEDATMEIFEKLIDSLKEHKVDNFPAWLHTISRNHCLMILRPQKKETSIEENEKLHLHIVEKEEDLHHNNVKEEELVLMEQAMDRLNKEQSLCLKLFFLSGKSYREVADETGYDIKQVKSHIQNGKKNLKKHIISLKDGKTG